MSNRIKIEIRAELRDQKGRLIKRTRWRRANSLICQFAQLLAVQMSQAAIVITNTAGTPVSTGQGAFAFAIIAGAGITAWGIQIGTGTDAVTMTDYKIKTQVTANVTHGPCTASGENPDASTWRVVISRLFTNNTGSLLSITEVALVCDAVGGGYRYCIDHSLYNVAIPSGSAVTITYRLTISL